MIERQGSVIENADFHDHESVMVMNVAHYNYHNYPIYFEDSNLNL